MKIKSKMILLFVLMALVMVTVYTFISVRSQRITMESNSMAAMNTIAHTMLMQMEHDVAMMETTITRLSQNTRLVEALGTIYELGESGETTTAYRLAQNTLSSELYQEPLSSYFYAINLFTLDGYLLSNQFEQLHETVTSYDDEMKWLLNELPFADQSRFNSFYLFAPHMYPWNILYPVNVYSACMPVFSKGHVIGYIEVNAREETLAQIFAPEELRAYRAAAILKDDGHRLNTNMYRQKDDTLHYGAIASDTFGTCTDDSGKRYYTASASSPSLGLTIYVSQEVGEFYRGITTMTANQILSGLAVLIVTVLIFLPFASSITVSITALKGKMSSADEKHILDYSLQTPHKVTRQTDREMRELENVYDDLIERLRQGAHREMLLTESSLQNQLNALQAQINPHFIYNTLNIISAKSMESGNEEVIDICDRFAQMLRYSTDLRSKTATLDEEITHVENYLLLCKARYEDKLRYYIRVPNEYRGLVLPRISLQPLFENAISHGFREAEKGLVIDLGAETDRNGDVILTVKDNGAGFSEEALKLVRAEFERIESSDFAEPPNTGGHIGLVNTYRRLYYYSRGRIRMRISNGAGALVELIIRHE